MAPLVPQWVDAFLRRDHAHLRDEDFCVFLREYTADQGYRGSETNSLFLNFKKKSDKRTRFEWFYKERAIESIAREFSEAAAALLDDSTLVPMPPSRVKGHPCTTTDGPGVAADARELLLQTTSLEPFHETDATRPTPAALAAVLAVDERYCEPCPTHIAVLDDVLTTGSHFVAARGVLQARFPGSGGDRSLRRPASSGS